jgi:predicted HicB family RNase H-like nuclease
VILIINEVIPRDLRRALEREAKIQNISLNDVAGRVMAEHFGRKWEDSGKPYRKSSERFRFSVPEEMHATIGAEARHRLATMRGLVLGTLAGHFDCKPITSGRKPRGGRK